MPSTRGRFSGESSAIATMGALLPHGSSVIAASALVQAFVTLRHLTRPGTAGRLRKGTNRIELPYIVRFATPAPQQNN